MLSLVRPHSFSFCLRERERGRERELENFILQGERETCVSVCVRACVRVCVCDRARVCDHKTHNDSFARATLRFPELCVNKLIQPTCVSNKNKITTTFDSEYCGCIPGLFSLATVPVL